MKVVITSLVLLLALIGINCRSAPTKKTDSPTIVKTAGVSEISPVEARPGVEAAYSQFVDVRTPEEFASGHANRARNIPLDSLAANLDMLEKNEPVYLICHSGNRSKKAAQILVDNGFSQAISIAGGMEAWQAAGLPMATESSVTK